MDIQVDKEIINPRYVDQDSLTNNLGNEIIPLKYANSNGATLKSAINVITKLHGFNYTEVALYKYITLTCIYHGKVNKAPQSTITLNSATIKHVATQCGVNERSVTRAIVGLIQKKFLAYHIFDNKIVNAHYKVNPDYDIAPYFTGNETPKVIAISL